MTNPSAPLAAVRDLSIEIDGKPLLSNLSVDIQPGTRHALIGDRGAGKTVLLKALAGMWPAASTVRGQVVTLGHELTAMTVDQRREQRRRAMLYLPPSGLDSLSPVETIGRQLTDICQARRVGSRRRTEERVIREQSRVVLRQLGIADPDRVLDSLPDELSGGMNKRVLLAIALLTDATFLTIDEPTKGLDVTTQRQFLDLLVRLQEERKFTLVIATQNLGVVAHYTSEVTLLENGRVLETDTPRQFFAAPSTAAGRDLLERARAW